MKTEIEPTPPKYGKLMVRRELRRKTDRGKWNFKDFCHALFTFGYRAREVFLSGRSLAH